MNVNAESSQSSQAIDTLEQLLLTRRSCRAFTAEPVPRETIKRLLALPQQTASWSNCQPWQVTVTEGEATRRLRERLLEAEQQERPIVPDFPLPDAYPEPLMARRRACGFGLYAALGIAREDRAARARQHLRNFEFFGAPHVAIISCHEALGVYGAVDCGAYIANFLLVAEALGLGAIVQGALVRHADLVRDTLGISAEQRAVCGIAFGYADPAQAVNRFKPERAGLDEAVRFVSA